MFISSDPVCRTVEGVRRSALLRGEQQAQAYEIGSYCQGIYMKEKKCLV